MWNWIDWLIFGYATNIVHKSKKFKKIEKYERKVCLWLTRYWCDYWQWEFENIKKNNKNRIYIYVGLRI